MTDKELLRLAAKAAGVPSKVVGAEPGLYFLYPGRDDVDKPTSLHQWNPLTNDGDALRLAVKLELLYSTSNATVESFIRAQFEPDPCAATRRAIVQAAAELGRRS